MRPRAVALTLLLLALGGSAARAGTGFAGGIVPAAVPAGASAAGVPAPGAVVGETPAATHTNWPSYSYWTAAYYGYPPRKYVGYGPGPNDFPYYGRPYGSPSDPWSWPAMAGYSSGVPTRYYPVLP